MKTPARRHLAAFAFSASVLTGGVTLASATPGAALAQGIFDVPKYAAIVVDAKTGEVLYAHNADAPRLPASVTKVMTLYMTFEALGSGKLSPTERITVSAHAASQAPSKLGLKPGETITVDDAIRAAAVKSANDMAVALAERVGGDEGRFTRMMTERAHELGMANTRFYNANGLPNPGANNITTARDLAILSRAVMRDYPQYYSYFSQREFVWRGHNTLNHNRLMLKMPGVDGIKTGYTRDAGFNLAASAVRDGRRLITVVLGGPSTAARDNNVETLLTAGFDVMKRRAFGQTITLAQAVGVPDDAAPAYARTAVQPGEPRPVVVADASPPPRPPAEPEAEPAMALASMAPIPNPPAARAPSAAAPALIAAADTAKPKLMRASFSKARVEDDEDEDKPDCAPAPKPRHDRHRHVRGVAKACHVAPTKVQIAQNSRKAAETDDCDGLRGRKLKACEAKATKAAKAEHAMMLAKADDACAKVRKARRKACETRAEVQIAKNDLKAVDVKSAKARAKAAAADDGDYLIQVGSFDNRKVAQAHMDKVSERFSRLVASAAGQISHAAGNYRVRFKGFTSETAARSACHKLSAKGERCMVVAEG